MTDEMDALKALAGKSPAFPAQEAPGGGAFLVPEEITRQMAVSVAQLGRIVSVLARKVEEMEAESAQRVTVTHAQALQLRKLIDAKAQAVIEQYRLIRCDSAVQLRRLIKKELLTRLGIRDLHDIPLAAWDRAVGIIDGWSNIQFVLMLKRE